MDNAAVLSSTMGLEVRNDAESMMPSSTLPIPRASHNVLEGIVKRRESGLLVLSPSKGKPVRRVLYVNSYGGERYLQRIEHGFIPSHHFWGCFDLVRKGYEIAVAEPLPDFYFGRHALPHDLRYLHVARSFLGRDGIVYCGHNVLYWLPLLKALGALRCKIVSLLFAREPLDLARAHSGVIALNPAAAEQARKLAPKAKVAHLGWGVDLAAFPKLDYHPSWFLSCGVTQRDHATLSVAAGKTAAQIRVITPRLQPGLTWPSNAVLVVGRDGGEAVSFRELLLDQYGQCSAALLILKNDPIQYTGVGMTNLIEAMAMGRPVIVTKTGALPTELDVEKTGCGLFVPPEDPQALGEAITTLKNNPRLAARMGATGRALCETHYNIVRYANDLHAFFESL